jgi:hypothetical protein
MKMSRYDRDSDGSRGDHRADGDVEFPGDHQQTNRNRDDAERGRNVEPTRGPRRGREVGAAEDREKDEYGGKTEERAGLGSAHEAAERKAVGLDAKAVGLSLDAHENSLPLGLRHFP